MLVVLCVPKDDLPELAKGFLKTAQFKQPVIALLRWLKSQMDAMWESASPEIQAAYGQEYHDALYNGAVSAAREAAKSMAPVIDAMEDAVLCVTPRIRYLVDGSNKILDLNNWLIRIGWFIPESTMDTILDYKYNKGLPQSSCIVQIQIKIVFTHPSSILFIKVYLVLGADS
ncbi:hypothetical protein MAR_028979 [Mya arenaria]|uniref:Uncharacterized protein n=1 Tax=Mya arenaria TaxID=6604 RepID=A0ABY7DIH5_MYAAR|nr:hypothetical protein MAR_028979 [Mya arenaria]